MFVSKVEVLDMARAMARHAAAMQAVAARNVANADTPGYAARDIRPFAEIWEGQGTPMRATRSGHSGSGGLLHVAAGQEHLNQSPNGNSVSLEAEMIRAAHARQSHEMALSIHRTLSGSIRAGLGRR